MLQLSRFYILLMGLVFGGLNSYAFPDTIRHGYTNCTTCHVSPSGGGLLNGYGRSLSRELLSTWSYKNEEQPLHGLVKLPESWMDSVYLGGDSRYLSRKYQSKDAHIDEGFLMQTQMRFGFAFNKLKVLASVGKIENPRKSQEVRLVSSEYYILWSPSDETHIRAGRFEPIYGLRMPDHNLWIKSSTGFLPWLEKDTIEFIYEGESQFVSLAGFQATSATNVSEQSTGYVASIYQILLDNNRVGLSILNSEGQGSRSRALSLHGTISFSEKAYALFELTRASLNESDKDVGFLRCGYEFMKGMTGIVQWQARMERNIANSEQSKPGIGFIFLPRPHFEFMALVEQIKKQQELSNESSVLVHYYF